MYSAKQYREDLFFGLYMAVGFTFIAAIPLGLLGLANLIAYVRHRPQELPWSTYWPIVVVVPASYFFAGILATSAAFLLRPLRRNLTGWILTGAIVAAIIYGSVGLALAVFYHPVGAALIDNSSQEELWGMIPLIMALLSPVGAGVGAYMWWRGRKGRPLW